MFGCHIQDKIHSKVTFKTGRYGPVMWVPDRHHGWAQKLGWKKGGLIRLQRGFCCFKINFLIDFYNSGAMGATVKLPQSY